MKGNSVENFHIKNTHRHNKFCINILLKLIFSFTNSYQFLQIINVLVFGNIIICCFVFNPIE